MGLKSEGLTGGDGKVEHAREGLGCGRHALLYISSGFNSFWQRLTFKASESLAVLEDWTTCSIGWKDSINAGDDEYRAATVSMRRIEVDSKSAFDFSLSDDSMEARSASSAGVLPEVMWRELPAAGATRSGKGTDGLSLRRGKRATTDPARKLIASGKNRFDSDSNWTLALLLFIQETRT